MKTSEVRPLKKFGTVLICVHDPGRHRCKFHIPVAVAAAAVGQPLLTPRKVAVTRSASRAFIGGRCEAIETLASRVRPKPQVFFPPQQVRTHGAKRSPRDPGQKMIKRVIALEGDIIRTLSYRNRYVRVPEGHCWVEGDHHGQSLDSNSFGPVSVGLLHARASHVVWPPNRWRRLQRDVPPNRDPIYVSAAGSDDEGDEDDAEAKGKDVKHSRDKRP
ncbi:mitochondrial inner membrane protease subunit 2 isoform X2 [Petromyzon marinus]